MSTITRQAHGIGITDTVRIISADSHVFEPGEVWLRVPQAFRERAAQFGHEYQKGDTGKPGGQDPQQRVEEMDTDGVGAEVIYPTYGIRALWLDDVPYLEALCRAYNDWLSEYCSAAPDRLVGLALLSVDNVDHAVKELERCRKQGLHGAIIRLEDPPAKLPFSSPHYELLWDAAQALETPISLHITTHLNDHPSWQFSANEKAKFTHNYHRQLAVCDALFDLIAYGVLDRYPRLKVVLAEFQVGWIPFTLQEWDKVLGSRKQLSPEQLPSRQFERQVYATFIGDPVGCRLLSGWGQDNCMWSSDYPHPVSTWPHSREAIAAELGHLDEAVRRKIICDNVVRVYPEALRAFA